MGLEAIKKEYKDELLLTKDVLMEFPDLVRLGFREQDIGRLLRLRVLNGQIKNQHGKEVSLVRRLSVIRLVLHINEVIDEDKITRIEIKE
jgi:hypothetical protein